jgi:heptosyltransferase-2
MSSDQFEGIRNLLVRGLNWIGDAVMSLPTIWNLRRAIPSARITVLAPRWSADLYKLCRAVQRVLEVPAPSRKFRIRDEIELAKELRDRKYDAVIVLPNSFHSVVAPFFARIPRRWGYGTDFRSLLLTKAVPLKEEDKNEHTVLYYRKLLNEIGIEWGGERFDLQPDNGSVDHAKTILLHRGAFEGLSKIGLAPGAAWGPSKRWPAKRFTSVAARLAERYGIQPMFFGSEHDRPLVNKIVSAIPGGAVNLAGAFRNLRHLVAAVSECKLMVTNDSGPMHIAAALGVPLVAIFGPTDEKRSGPWSIRGNAVVLSRNPECRPCYSPFCRVQGWPCMNGVKVSDVMKATERLLDGGKRSDHDEF